MTINEPVFAAMLILALVAVGEIISVLTRARVPMLLVAILGFLVLVWTGIFPKNIVDTSSFNGIGTLLTGPLVVHLGTLIPLSMMSKQYKAVIISLGGALIALVLVLPIITLLFGYETAVAGMGPIVGGIVAFLVTSTELKELGFESLVAIPALVLAIHKLFGMPVASIFLRKYALILRDKTDLLERHKQTAATLETTMNHSTALTKKKKKYEFNTANVLLFKLFLGASIATVIGNVTGVSSTIWCLVIGIIGARVKFYDENIMDKAKASSIAILGTIFIVIASMSTVSLKEFLHFIPQILAIIVIGQIGIILGGYLFSKLTKWHPYKGMSLALTAMFGFPADYILCQEVSRSVGRTEEEQQILLNELSPPMLIAGFTTVTVASVIIASILVKTL
ncbi:hypothetical protein B5V88_07435 [Heyndrickxia sporothermodurans]|uniref:Integral membrane protein n=1 Tax=Heyndrickxia sporothermodurans TaxID=46224 RepID=A0AB37HF55_9BACI|nr:hypothetical protein [Heyndrickxia sporothermodurans]MBL5767010.1 hypothetical protein [Heyndrickxia sporothermodurans]MBL5770478.1 hypothetical protein [Heyndrickxia sporothermodurans]MBL5774167.1 hypothetical protein [Heyndrickxia sporothermodurans]MBL5778289.1 hypothetical protein [Heyndrickxia sporothermodurans]MBL5780704.1 hypothetical protein [Heyndrickxia sporothermodurans]